MKIMIASDIHGSSYYCEEMLRVFAIERAERLVLLGDLLYHGPRNDLPRDYAPKQVIGMLNGVKESLLCVRGNCEAEVDQMVLEFPVLADYAMICVDDLTILATHGHKWNESALPPLKKGDILLNGHTHVPKCTVHEDYIYMNPGSVSIPKENSPHSYIIYENGVFQWKSLEGQIFNEYKNCEL